MDSKNDVKFKELIVIGMLVLITIVSAFIEFSMTFKHYTGIVRTIEVLTNLGMLFTIVYYALFAYNRPHSNMLKYLLVTYSGYCLVTGMISIDASLKIGVLESQTLLTILNITFNCLTGMIAAYISGRLNKNEKNFSLIVIATIAQLASSFLYIIGYPQRSGFAEYLWCFNSLVLWLDIIFIYYYRYDEHIQAGLKEK